MVADRHGATATALWVSLLCSAAAGTLGVIVLHHWVGHDGLAPWEFIAVLAQVMLYAWMGIWLSVRHRLAYWRFVLLVAAETGLAVLRQQGLPPCAITVLQGLLLTALCIWLNRTGDVGLALWLGLASQLLLLRGAVFSTEQCTAAAYLAGSSAVAVGLAVGLRRPTPS